MAKRLLLAASVFAAGCAAGPTAPLTVAEMPDIDPAGVMDHIRTLSSDEYEGRAPGSPGETLTVDYLTGRFRGIGLEPGNPDGTFVQNVPLVGITPSHFTPLSVQGGGQSREFDHDGEVVAFSQRVTKDISVADSEIVFVGYGVEAPEYQWDDFKNADLAGKTLVMLVNDPPVTTAGGELDPDTFGGRAMTYYGRWTYKYEKAAELGAAAVFVVHEAEPAGYPYSVVQGFGGERFDLVTPDRNMGRAAIQGWLSLDAATELLQMAGQDFGTLKARAATREFEPVPLGLTASMSFDQAIRTVDSRNVIAKLPGSNPELADEYVVYMAHWDHLGVGTPVDGDAIYNGAHDNASGTAAILEIARGLAAMEPGPQRSVLFLAVTAEEQGLLGSRYYAEFPLYPLRKTLAAINLDGTNTWGRTRDVVAIGLGASELDDYLRAAAREQGRALVADAEPEKGFYYRSDHFNFAKVGVPALYTDEGTQYIGKPEGYGQQKRDEYTSADYHAPSDEIKPDWDLSGLVEDAKLLLAVGYRVANAERYPEWRAGSEFKAIRDKTLNR